MEGGGVAGVVLGEKMLVSTQVGIRVICMWATSAPGGLSFSVLGGGAAQTMAVFFFFWFFFWSGGWGAR